VGPQDRGQLRSGASLPDGAFELSDLAEGHQVTSAPLDQPAASSARDFLANPSSPPRSPTRSRLTPLSKDTVDNRLRYC
jgi:hypothetical protein